MKHKLQDVLECIANDDIKTAKARIAEYFEWKTQQIINLNEDDQKILDDKTVELEKLLSKSSDK